MSMLDRIIDQPVTNPKETEPTPGLATEAFSDLSTAPVPVEASPEAGTPEEEVQVLSTRRHRSQRFSVRGLSTSSELLEVRRRATRQARGKSVLLGVYIFIDLVYCLTRFIVVLPGVEVEIETSRYWKPFAILCTLGSKQVPGAIDWSGAWIGFVSWTSYFIANVLLVIGVISLKIRFYYAYITLKTSSMILHFLGLIIYGFDCNEDTLVLEVSLFLVLHLPLQIMGVKLCSTLIRSVRRAKRGASILVRQDVGTEVPRSESFNSQKSSPAAPHAASSTQGKRWYTT